MQIWQSLPKPFFVLAPLEGVTDTTFRQIVVSCAKPDLLFTEFTSADGFCSPGREAVAQNFKYTEGEQPLIVQIWGKNPDAMYRTAVEVSTMGFAGIDINMGCPAGTVIGHGCGAALIKTPDLAAELIAAVKKGVDGRIPVSVKTRIGFKNIVTEEWIPFLLKQGIDNLTVHGRTAAEMSKVPAHWDEIGKAVEIRNRMGITTTIVGNGDVVDVADGMNKHAQFGVDGIMIGRGIFANPWCFDKSEVPHIGTTEELLDVMERHVKLFDATWGERKNYALLKKFFKIYINGFAGAVDARVQFMETQTAAEALALLGDLRHRLQG
jgi:nifR3 family TIM-barrel protein